MDETDDTGRMIAACEHCGALYAALEISDEKIRPIGRRDGCQCGSTDFVAVDGTGTGLSLRNDSDKSASR